MKILIAIFFVLASTAQAEIIANKVILKATRLNQNSAIRYVSGTGNVIISMDDGKIVLEKTTIEEAATEFWKKISSFYEVIDNDNTLSTSGLRPTNISIPCKSGYVSICINDGTVRWPKVPDMPEGSKLFWDAVVLAYKGSPAETLCVAKGISTPIKIK